MGSVDGNSYAALFKLRSNNGSLKLTPTGRVFFVEICQSFQYLINLKIRGFFLIN